MTSRNADAPADGTPGTGGRNQRVDRRFKAFLPVEAMIRNVRSRVHVLDISLSGAKVHIGEHVDPQGPADLNLHGEFFPTRIVWAARGRVGLKFLDNLTISQVEQLIGGDKSD